MNFLLGGFNKSQNLQMGDKILRSTAIMSNNMWIFQVVRIVLFVLFVILVVFLIKRNKNNKYLNLLKKEYALGNLTEDEYLNKLQILKSK